MALRVFWIKSFFANLNSIITKKALFIFDKLKNYVLKLIYFAIIWTIDCFARGAAISGPILISQWILVMKNFLDLNGARPFFFKIFPICKRFYVNSWQESQIRAKLVMNTINKKESQQNYYMVSELSSWFLWLWPIVFEKFFQVSWVLLSFVILFVAQWLSSPNQRSN